MTAKQHVEAKKRVINLAASLDIRFAAVAALHAVPSQKVNRWRFQVDALLLAFRDFLAEDGSSGLVVPDRLDTVFPRIEERFQHGVVSERKLWPNLALGGITLFAAGASQSSHLASLADIVLGSFRYCVNDTAELHTSHDMLRALVSLLWKRREEDRYMVRERGLMLRPRNVWHADHKNRCDELIARLERIANREEE